MKYQSRSIMQRGVTRLLVTVGAIGISVMAFAFLLGSSFHVNNLQAGAVFDASVAHAAAKITDLTGTPGATETGTPGSTTTVTPGTTETGTPGATETGTPGGTETGTPGATTTGTPGNTGTPGATTTGTPQPVCEPIANAAVSITGSSFVPSSITIDPGTRVTWTNNSSSRHRVRDINHVIFDSGDLQAGQSFSYIFCVPGTYPYHDSRSGFTGTIVVTGTPPTGTPGGTGTPGATGTPGTTQTMTPGATVTEDRTVTPGTTQTTTPGATATEDRTVTPGTTGTPGATGTPGTTQTLTPGATVTEDRTVTPGTTGTPNATGTPWGSTLITGHVVWQGRPAQPNALQQLPITLTLKSGTIEVNYPIQTTDSNGFFTLDSGPMQYGTYQWRIKGPKYLANVGNATLSGNALTIDMGLMRVGDANNDNVVNVTDFNIMKVTFGKGIGDPNYDDRADFTGDHAVNVSDFNLLKVNFGSAGGNPTGPAVGTKN